MHRFVVAALIAGVATASAGTTQLTKVDVSLGDVSINKVPQLVAADQGIYAKYGLDVHQTISAGAARAAAGSGVVVPEAYINRTPDAAAPIEVGGGSPMIYGVVNNGRPPRAIVLTQEAMAMDHVIAKAGIASVQDLKGKRLGFSGVGSVTHFSALALARQLGLTPERDITLVPGSATLDALKQDKVDAILGSAMVIARAPELGYKDIGDMTTYKIPMAGSGIMELGFRYGIRTAFDQQFERLERFRREMDCRSRSRQEPSAEVERVVTEADLHSSPEDRQNERNSSGLSGPGVDITASVDGGEIHPH